MDQSTIKAQFITRPATLVDAEAIGMIHTESWKTTYQGIMHQSFIDGINLNKRIRGAEKRIKNLTTTCLVLVDYLQDKVIGFADVGPCREKNVNADGELYSIYLYQHYQNQGGGKILFNSCISAAKVKNYEKMMTSVLEKNISSRKFYEKMGGAFIGSDHVDIEGHRYPTSTYIWSLK